MSLFSPSLQWRKLAGSIAEIQWMMNNLSIAEIEGKKITLALFNNKVYATSYKCPHAGAVMAEGYIDTAGNIVCPLHRYKFSLEKGRNVSGEGYYLKTYKVEEREDGIYIFI